MGFLARLVMFGAIVAGVGVVGKLVNGTLFESRNEVVRVDRVTSRSARAAERRARAERAIAPEAPEAPAAPHGPDAAEIRAIVESAQGIAAQVSKETAVAIVGAAEVEALVKERKAEEIRIVSRNGATFLSVRHNDIVAGLSDSLRLHIASQMDEKRSKSEGSNKLGDMIASTVMQSVQKLVGKEIVVPIDQIESAELDGNRIVLEYRGGKPDGLLTLENIQFDDKGDFLEQFRSSDAKRFVRVVKSHIK